MVLRRGERGQFHSVCDSQIGHWLIALVHRAPAGDVSCGCSKGYLGDASDRVNRGFKHAKEKLKRGRKRAYKRMPRGGGFVLVSVVREREKRAEEREHEGKCGTVRTGAPGPTRKL